MGRWLGWAALLWLLGTADVLAQGAGGLALARAERLYAEGSYDAVLGLLSSYLAEERTPAQEKASYRLVILSYLAKEQLPEAKHAAIKLLNRQPAYEPDPDEDPSSYVSLLQEVRRQLLRTSSPSASCEQLLAEGEGKYLEGALDEAIRLVTNCLFTATAAPAQTAQGFRLLALSHLEKGDIGEARSMIQRLLRMQPAYEADPIEDPPTYVALVGLVRDQLQVRAVEAVDPQSVDLQEENHPREGRPWFRSSKGWAVVGSGLLIAGLTVVVTRAGGGSGGESRAPLPGPPSLPN